MLILIFISLWILALLLYSMWHNENVPSLICDSVFFCFDHFQFIKKNRQICTHMQSNQSNEHLESVQLPVDHPSPSAIHITDRIKKGYLASHNLSRQLVWEALDIYIYIYIYLFNSFYYFPLVFEEFLKKRFCHFEGAKRKKDKIKIILSFGDTKIWRISICLLISIALSSSNLASTKCQNSVMKSVVWLFNLNYFKFYKNKWNWKHHNDQKPHSNSVHASGKKYWLVGKKSQQDFCQGVY